MAVRLTAVRRVAGTSSMAQAALVALAIVAGGPAFRQALAAPVDREPGESRSVLVHPTGTAAVRMPAGARIVSDRRVDEPAPVSDGPGIPGEPVAPGTIIGDSFPQQGAADGAGPGGQFEQYEQPPAGSVVSDGATGGSAEPWEQGSFGPDGQPMGGPAACGNGDCNGHCDVCQGYAGLDPAWQYNAGCEPPGLFQRLYGLCRPKEGCWTGRADALILSRNAPAARPLYTYSGGFPVAVDANDLESIAAVGPRVSLFNRDHCNTSWEGTYIYSGAFVSDRNYTNQIAPFTLAFPGIYGFTGGDVDIVQTRLVSSLQSAELNRRWNWGPVTQFLIGFRWLQWQESLLINDYYSAGQDSFNTNTYNSLYGGQIGLDTLLWRPSKWLRFEGLIKAGGYFNSASQSSQFVSVAGGVPTGGYVNVGRSPATGSFAGELGLTAVVPLHRCIDFRVGYFGLWLTSIAQPSDQLAGQQMVVEPFYGSLVTNGNVVLQGLSLGLEGRW
jgi:hypothetical protein